ncbi:MAG: N-acetylmuramoyl-L-alanine amidase [Negativicutes bacterium]|nr:N-acetylmuramoyl-L-alanine amidase [Negativicutes bacterium]
MRTTCFLAILLIVSLFSGVCSANPGLLDGKIITLDPGHGGNNDGAVHFGVREADVNLAIGLKLRDKLAAAGATVVMTRTTDRSVAVPGSGAAGELQARVDVAAAADADIFVSLHANAHPNEETAGAISFYPAGRPSDLALAIQPGLVGEVGMVDKGVRPANFYVLRNSDIPAALIEVGFLTNKAEAARLADDKYQAQIAEGIFKGLLRYFLTR